MPPELVLWLHGKAALTVDNEVYKVLSGKFSEADTARAYRLERETKYIEVTKEKE